MFCQPTTDLVDRTAGDMLKRSGIFTEAIHKKNSQRPVADITKYLFKSHPDDRVLFITQSAFERINADFDRSRYDLIVDEIPNVIHCFDQNLTESHEIVTSFIGRLPVAGTPYDILTASDIEQLEAIADNENDDEVWKHFKDLANIILSRWWESYVDRRAYERVIIVVMVVGMIVWVIIIGVIVVVVVIIWMIIVIVVVVGIFDLRVGERLLLRGR